MATGFKVNGVDIDTIFAWAAGANQSDDSTGYKLSNGYDISKYMYNVSTSDHVAVGYKSNGNDIGLNYCTTGCNGICTSCTGCSGTCTSCTGACFTTCTSTCANSCYNDCSGSCDGRID